MQYGAYRFKYFLFSCYRAKLHDLSICLELFYHKDRLFSHGLQYVAQIVGHSASIILIHWPYFEHGFSVHFFLTFPSYILYFNALAC